MKTHIHLGDCLEKLKTFKDSSVDALVTDPPAGISFMGKDWDHDKGGRKHWIAWMTEVMTECLRVMKPGAHGLVWALPRTSHWTATALEDAGFEVRDVVTHLYGQGFPKSHCISKAIDKQAGAKREVLGTRTEHNIKGNGENSRLQTSQGKRETIEIPITAPATAAAKQWEGWGTALKPASEHWVLVRKPISEKTVAANVLKWGCGGLNIDGCRVEYIGQPYHAFFDGSLTFAPLSTYGKVSKLTPPHTQGRFPANLILDEEAAQALDVQSGISTSRAGNPNRGVKDSSKAVTSFDAKKGVGQEHNDSGGASRFFYVAKASKSDKGEGNNHPTPKSTKLMEYLIKLVTPPNGIVLDPFMGSGSTGVAVQNLWHSFVGIEKEEKYFKIAEKRLTEGSFIEVIVG